MPINPNFDQYDFDISSDGQKYSKKLIEDIQNSWSATTREQISSVEHSDEYMGQIYSIKFKGPDVLTIPTLGGHTDALIAYRWGYFTYTEDTLYVGPIIPASSNNKEYVFEGRENVEFDIPSIRQCEEPKLSIKDVTNRDERRIKSLKYDIISSWPTETINTINNIKCSSGSRNSYIINTESDTVFEEDDNGDSKIVDRSVPDSPLEKHVDVLLHNGWAVTSIKSNSLFVARPKMLNNNSPYKYRFEGKNKKNMAYVPKRCDFCEHEYYDHLVTDVDNKYEMELPVYSRACKSCIEDSKYLTAEEFRENKNNKLESKDE